TIPKGSEEARPDFDRRRFSRLIFGALAAGCLFYVLVIGVVTFVYPWQTIVAGHVRTEVAVERAFGSHALAELILFAAFLSLLKVFNGNFVAATRMMYALGRHGLTHASLGRVQAARGTPVVAMVWLTLVSIAGTLLGDAVLVPITEVGALAGGVGWL